MNKKTHASILPFHTHILLYYYLPPEKNGEKSIYGGKKIM